jgi:hypothetical protein
MTLGSIPSTAKKKKRRRKEKEKEPPFAEHSSTLL